MIVRLGWFIDMERESNTAPLPFLFYTASAGFVFVHSHSE